MGCEDLRPHLTDHLTGVLPAPLAARVAAHLRECPTCASEAESLGDTWRMLGDIGDPLPDSAAMRARLDGAVEGYRHALGDHARPVMPHTRVTRLWSGQLAMQAAAAVLLLSTGVLVGRQTVTPPATDPQLSQVRDELHQMRQLVTLSLLQQQSASERLKGVTWSGQLEQPDKEVVSALLQTLMHDPNVNVRLATIDALQRFGQLDAVRTGVIEALPQQTSPLVQIALIDFLVESRAAGSADTLKQLSEDPALDDAVRARATWGLSRVG